MRERIVTAQVRLPETPAHLLVADDSSLDRKTVSRILEAEGYRVTSCRDGVEALQAACREMPDLVLLDFEMPRMGGVETCRCLKRLDGFERVPILFISAHEELDLRVEGFDAGAVDFITKPFERLDVLARIRAHHRVGELTRLLTETKARLEARNRELDEDLRAAGEIQRSLLPRAHLSLPRLRSHWHFQPCHRVGGDLFHHHRLDANHVGAYVLDVEGHGVPAAMVSAHLSRSLDPRGGITKRIFRSQDGDGYEVVAPGAAMAALDAEYPADRFERNVTLCYCLFDLECGRMTYTSAGHPAPLLQRRDGTLRALTEGGPLIGLAMDLAFPEETVDLEPGDRVYLFTDGIPELADEAGRPFGFARIEEILRTSAREPIDAVCNRIVVTALGHAAGVPPADDLTVVALEYRGD